MSRRLTDMPPAEALKAIADWLEDCEDRQILSPRPGLPDAPFDFAEAFVLVRLAAEAEAAKDRLIENAAQLLDAYAGGVPLDLWRALLTTPVDRAKGETTLFEATPLPTRSAALQAALGRAVAIAGEAAEEWDKAPSGMKAGKILIALAGHLPGYRKDTDQIHAVLRSAQVSPPLKAEIVDA